MHKAQETVLEIDLGSLTHNFNYLKSKLKPETRFMAVVKAYAYGNDAVAIAKHLESKGADYFAVAYTPEGIALRKAGITKPILVLHTLPVHFNEIVTYQLEPNLYNFHVLNEFIAYAKEKSIRSYPVHLKFNTGLNRLGFNENDLEALVPIIKNEKTINVTSLFSHLAASEDLKVKDFTLNQIHTFKAIAHKFKKDTGQHPLLHILNTSGILNFADVAELDMVRSGIGLYGFGNDARFDKHLIPIATLKSIISQIHTIEKGQGIGYNMGFIATATTRTATIPVGHADGIGRHFGKGKGFVTINNQQAPIIGNVCMDMIMVDVTDIDCNTGDEVIIFGKQHTAERFAEKGNTISYELITGISQRVKRVFLK